MLKKIQTYLLENHPILWNVRILPMAAILAGLHLLFFGLGYIFTNTKFTNTYYYNDLGSNLGFLYFFCILTAVLLLIGWLIFYFRNNGFRTLYPCRTSRLYLEWLLIFVITTGIALLPFSMTKGYEVKWKSVATEQEVKEALALLGKIELLIPDISNCKYYRDYNYYDSDEVVLIEEVAPIDEPAYIYDCGSSFYYKYSSETDQPIPVSGNLKINCKDYPDVFNCDNRTAGYIAPSLLFHKPAGVINERDYDCWKERKNVHDSTSYSINFSCGDDTRWLSFDDIRRIENSRLMKSLLKEEWKDSIYAMMVSFNKLQQKHRLKIDITPDEWFKRIYHPPFFPVNELTAIYRNDRDGYYRNDDGTYRFPVLPPGILPVSDKSWVPNKSRIPYLQYEELKSGYEHIEKFYKKNDFLEIFLLITFCISMIISMFIFSFRVTTGKHWLIALVTLGVCAFVIILFLVFLNTFGNVRDGIVIYNFFAWLALFIIPFLRIILKIKEKEQKGRSNIYMNIVLWYIPCLIPLAFWTYVIARELHKSDYNLSEQVITNMFWINILVMIPVMWLVARFVREWKGLAEE